MAMKHPCPWLSPTFGCCSISFEYWTRRCNWWGMELLISPKLMGDETSNFAVGISSNTGPLWNALPTSQVTKSFLLTAQKVHWPEYDLSQLSDPFRPNIFPKEPVITESMWKSVQEMSPAALMCMHILQGSQLSRMLFCSFIRYLSLIHIWRCRRRG